MAEGVENAAAICCFLTPKYQDSVACKDELTYGKERGVQIIPVRLIANWKPSGWLGFTITGHKWIDFRDFDRNTDLRIQQLIAEIQMLAGNKLDCFQGIELFNSLSLNSNPTSMENKPKVEEEEEEEEMEFDSDYYHRLTVQSQGEKKSIDIINDGTNNKVTLATTGNYSGQHWKLSHLGDGYYRLTTEWQGEDKSLDVVNDGKYNNKVLLSPSGDYSGQKWKITSVGNGFYRLTTLWQGDDKSLSFTNNTVMLAKTKDSNEQYWKITRS